MEQIGEPSARLLRRAAATATVLLGLLAALSLGAGDGAVVVVSVDVPCALFAEDELVARVDPGRPAEVGLAPGVHALTLLSLESAEVRREETVSVRDGDRRELEVELAEEVADHAAAAPGVAFGAPDSRLSDQGDGTVLDPESGLLWTRLDNNFDLDWETAERYCQTVALGPSGDGDAGAWRLPTVEELEALVEPHARTELGIVDGIRLSGCCPWSAELHGAVSAWYVSFETGRKGFVTRDFSDGGRVLCVR